MRLIKAADYTMEEFPSDVPEYAILSHTWLDDEVTLQDWADLDSAKKKKGFKKIKDTCYQALKDGVEWVWVDTNCIDKTSSAELSEAINSMFQWYRDSKHCYVYLADVSVKGVQQPPARDGGTSGDGIYLSLPEVRSAVEASRWFTRGWTLQELIAPTNVVFYSSEWQPLGTKAEANSFISEVTGIDASCLREPSMIPDVSVARRMSWISGRKTTRVEDMAYCMLGIFDINMALLYGEGDKAFLRLQEEIIKVSNDQSIFCWQRSSPDDGKVPKNWISILAPNPAVFRESGQFFPLTSTTTYGGGSSFAPYAAAPSAAAVDAYSITNHGLRITVPLLHTAMGACAVLNVSIRAGLRNDSRRVLVLLHRVSRDNDCHYVRLLADLLVTAIPPQLMEARTQVYVDCRNARVSGVDDLVFMRRSSSRVDLTSRHGNVFLLAFNKSVTIESKPMMHSGMEFHPLDSAIEVVSDLSTERGAVILKGEVEHGGSFLVFVGAMKDPDDRNAIKWHVEVAVRDEGALDKPTTELVPLSTFLGNLERELFGTWAPTGPLQMVWSWSYSDMGATVCVLELKDIERRSEAASRFEDTQFRTLQRYPYSMKSSMLRLHRAASR